MDCPDYQSIEWKRQLVVSVALSVLFGRILYNPRQFGAVLITYLSMLSLWPITVGGMLYVFYKHPKRFVVFYTIFYLLTNKRDAHHDGSMVSSWLGGPGFLARTISSYLRSNVHVPYMESILAGAAAGSKYVIAVHPHSMFGISTLVNFAVNRLVTRGLFQGQLDFRVLTINMNFWIPILREYLMYRGFVCADSTTFSTLLKKGISPVIVPGGAEETLLTAPGSADLILNKRQGFVREALVNGASLIPVYCFGDNEAVPVLRSKRIQRIQRLIQKWLTFATPICTLTFNRTPLHMVVGEPLAPPPESAGSFDDRVSMYHEMYKKALVELFNQSLPKYGTPAEKAGKGIRFVK